MEYCDDVNDWLTVGADLTVASILTGHSNAETIGRMRERGVTHVLDLRDDRHDRDVWLRNGLGTANYCHAPIIDFRGHTPPESWYRRVERFVERFWENSYDGDRLYVHCQMGINRGPSASMLALLTVYDDLDPWTAFMMLREARPVAGVVYAEQIGLRHLSEDPTAMAQWVSQLDDYWTPEQIAEARSHREWIDIDYTIETRKLWIPPLTA